ncbi:MAG TPA: ammonia-forming cytochrome c nitrite reductase subunit c552 [Tepidisphaeraceae bacterium]|nr:ammonia-forming cytochrome c nitrite reductase subunit c552 [Tepidisphaeraceae bacterium]
MADEPTKPSDDKPAPADKPRRHPVFFAVVVLLVALATAGVTALLVNMFQRKAEARQQFVRVVDVTESHTDPSEWGKNWPREYDSYKRTTDNERTRYGGSEGMPEQRLDRDPWLRRMYAGYAFAIDFRDRRGHAFMLYDQEQTERVAQKPQGGACLHCHASMTTTWRRVGLEAEGKSLADSGPHDFNWPAVQRGFEHMSKMSYAQAHAELMKTPDGTPDTNTPFSRDPKGEPQATPKASASTTGTAPTTREAIAAHAGQAHPVSCIDCHAPASMELRVTRPGFVNGIRALASSKEPTPHIPSIERWRKGSRAKPYDPNVDATRQEMRSFVCGQCHVEYYCATRETLFFPWGDGLKVEQIESNYDKFKFKDTGERFYDYKHGETGAELIKAQHPEFELWSQGTHGKAGVSCSDCHMPYVREGAMKVSDHQVRSPLLMVNRSCQVCHPTSEKELTDRAQTIQNRTHTLINRSSVALIDMLDAIKAARQAGVTLDQLKPVLELQRKAQWRLDFIASENSMGFHAAQEAARVLAESIDYSRQAVSGAQALHLAKTGTPVVLPATRPIEGVTPADKAPPAPYKPIAVPVPPEQR